MTGRALGVLALLLVGPSCYASHELGGVTMTDAGPAARDASPATDAGLRVIGIVYPDCGPTDGAALRIEVGIPFACGATPAPGTIVISIFGLPPTDPGSARYDLGGSGGAAATRCDASGLCATADSGVVSVSGFVAGRGLSVEGVFRFGGETLGVSGAVVWCDRHILCG